MVKIVRRFLVMAALALWQGGFTFYASFVVPVGVDVLGSHLDQGFITQRVTDRLNLVGALALPILAWDLATGSGGGRWLKRWQWVNWALLAVTLGGLCWLHLTMDAMLDADQHDILEYESFRRSHRQYLMVSTLQWGISLVFLAVTLWCWRREDAAVE
jgi:hypothetical protein